MVKLERIGGMDGDILELLLYEDGSRDQLDSAKD